MFVVCLRTKIGGDRCGSKLSAPTCESASQNPNLGFRFCPCNPKEEAEPPKMPEKPQEDKLGPPPPFDCPDGKFPFKVYFFSPFVFPVSHC